MKFEYPLVEGRLVERYKRFFADVELLSGKTVTAHCANTGAMTGLKDPGLEVWLSPANNPKRKLKWTWELTRIGDGLVGINTQHPNRLVADAITDGTISELQGYDVLRREVKYGTNSRIDILLENDGKPPCYVEIKNVHLKRGGGAEFPDAVTSRGKKHLNELSEVVRDGGRSVMVYLIQREDCDTFSLAADVDPDYAEAFHRAREAGVEALAYACRLTPLEITVIRPIDLNL